MLPKGLTSQEAQRLLSEQGENLIPEKKTSFVAKTLKKLLSPISLMLFAAAFLSLFTKREFDFFFILFLLALNVVLSIWQEGKADKAIATLNEKLTSTVRVLRDGSWQRLDSRMIVPDDIIQIKTGEIIPADAKTVESTNFYVNESALTGESLPKEKNPGDTIYSGAYATSGIATVQVTATGKKTYFGKVLYSIERSTKRSILEQDIINITKFLSILSIVGVALMSTVLLTTHISPVELLTLDLSLIIAGIPISLPTVMTLIIEIGVIELAKKQVIVRRISALEDFANVNMLLTDKTGTLTKNEINVKKILAYSGFSIHDVIRLAAAAYTAENEDLINAAIGRKAADLLGNHPKFVIRKFLPADSSRKHSTMAVTAGGKDLLIAVGAPQIIETLCKPSSETAKSYATDVSNLAKSGARSLAVAMKETSTTQEKDMRLAGLLALSDDLRDDAKGVIQFLQENGIGVVMLTGDHAAIAREIAKDLGLGGKRIMTRKELTDLGYSRLTRDTITAAGAFAEILPDDKFQLVKYARGSFIVAVTGDGVNDIPAVKDANVGIAVKNAVSSLKSAADLVLLSDGINVIKDAILESRRIFARLYSYSMYRISESLRLIVTIVWLGIVFKTYPLTPLQIILIALLNDIPIITLAFDRVALIKKPSSINVRGRFILSSLFGLAGVANSLILFYIMTELLHLSWPVIQTVYFLKLTVSGHMLIYVAHTRERWWRFLPSHQVIIATSVTQLLASVLAFAGVFMPASIPLSYIVAIWIWSFFWMQISELMKNFSKA